MYLFLVALVLAALPLAQCERTLYANKLEPSAGPFVTVTLMSANDMNVDVLDIGSLNVASVSGVVIDTGGSFVIQGASLDAGGQNIEVTSQGTVTGTAAGGLTLQYGTGTIGGGSGTTIHSDAASFYGADGNIVGQSNGVSFIAETDAVLETGNRNIDLRFSGNLNAFGSNGQITGFNDITATSSGNVALTAADSVSIDAETATFNAGGGFTVSATNDNVNIYAGRVLKASLGTTANIAGTYGVYINSLRGPVAFSSATNFNYNATNNFVGTSTRLARFQAGALATFNAGKDLVIAGDSGSIFSANNGNVQVAATLQDFTINTNTFRATSLDGIYVSGAAVDIEASDLISFRGGQNSFTAVNGNIGLFGANLYLNSLDCKTASINIDQAAKGIATSITAGHELFVRSFSLLFSPTASLVINTHQAVFSTGLNFDEHVIVSGTKTIVDTGTSDQNWNGGTILLKSTLSSHFTAGSDLKFTAINDQNDYVKFQATGTINNAVGTSLNILGGEIVSRSGSQQTVSGNVLTASTRNTKDIFFLSNSITESATSTDSHSAYQVQAKYAGTTGFIAKGTSLTLTSGADTNFFAYDINVNAPTSLTVTASGGSAVASNALKITSPNAGSSLSILENTKLSINGDWLFQATAGTGKLLFDMSNNFHWESPLLRDITFTAGGDLYYTAGTTLTATSRVSTVRANRRNLGITANNNVQIESPTGLGSITLSSLNNKIVMQALNGGFTADAGGNFVSNSLQETTLTAFTTFTINADERAQFYGTRQVSVISHNGQDIVLKASDDVNYLAGRDILTNVNGQSTFFSENQLLRGGNLVRYWTDFGDINFSAGRHLTYSADIGETWGTPKGGVYLEAKNQLTVAGGKASVKSGVDTNFKSNVDIHNFGVDISISAAHDMNVRSRNWLVKSQITEFKAGRNTYLKAQAVTATTNEGQTLYIKTDNNDVTFTSGNNLYVDSNDDIRARAGFFDYTVYGNDAANRDVWIATDAQKAGINIATNKILDISTTGRLHYQVTDYANNGHDLNIYSGRDTEFWDYNAKAEGIFIDSLGSTYDGLLGEYVGVLFRANYDTDTVNQPIPAVAKGDVYISSSGEVFFSGYAGIKLESDAGNVLLQSVQQFTQTTNTDDVFSDAEAARLNAHSNSNDNNGGGLYFLATSTGADITVEATNQQRWEASGFMSFVTRSLKPDVDDQDFGIEVLADSGHINLDQFGKKNMLFDGSAGVDIQAGRDINFSGAQYASFTSAKNFDLLVEAQYGATYTTAKASGKISVISGGSTSIASGAEGDCSDVQIKNGRFATYKAADDLQHLAGDDWEQTTTNGNSQYFSLLDENIIGAGSVEFTSTDPATGVTIFSAGDARFNARNTIRVESALFQVGYNTATGPRSTVVINAGGTTDKSGFEIDAEGNVFWQSGAPAGAYTQIFAKHSFKQHSTHGTAISSGGSIQIVTTASTDQNDVFFYAQEDLLLKAPFGTFHTNNPNVVEFDTQFNHNTISRFDNIVMQAQEQITFEAFDYLTMRSAKWDVRASDFGFASFGKQTWQAGSIQLLSDDKTTLDSGLDFQVTARGTNSRIQFTTYGSNSDISFVTTGETSDIKFEGLANINLLSIDDTDIDANVNALSNAVNILAADRFSTVAENYLVMTSYQNFELYANNHGDIEFDSEGALNVTSVLDFRMYAGLNGNVDDIEVNPTGAVNFQTTENLQGDITVNSAGRLKMTANGDGLFNIGGYQFWSSAQYIDFQSSGILNGVAIGKDSHKTYSIGMRWTTQTEPGDIHLVARTGSVSMTGQTGAYVEADGPTFRAGEAVDFYAASDVKFQTIELGTDILVHANNDLSMRAQHKVTLQANGGQVGSGYIGVSAEGVAALVGAPGSGFGIQVVSEDSNVVMVTERAGMNFKAIDRVTIAGTGGAPKVSFVAVGANDIYDVGLSLTTTRQRITQGNVETDTITGYESDIAAISQGDLIITSSGNQIFHSSSDVAPIGEVHLQAGTTFSITSAGKNDDGYGISFYSSRGGSPFDSGDIDFSAGGNLQLNAGGSVLLNGFEGLLLYTSGDQTWSANQNITLAGGSEFGIDRNGQPGVVLSTFDVDRDGSIGENIEFYSAEDVIIRSASDLYASAAGAITFSGSANTYVTVYANNGVDIQIGGGGADFQVATGTTYTAESTLTLFSQNQITFSSSIGIEIQSSFASGNGWSDADGDIRFQTVADLQDTNFIINPPNPAGDITFETAPPVNVTNNDITLDAYIVEIGAASHVRIPFFTSSPCGQQLDFGGNLIAGTAISLPRSFYYDVSSRMVCFCDYTNIARCFPTMG